MPTYDFENTKTGKQFTEFMSMSEKDKYLKKNKHIRQCLNKINIVGGVGGMKTDSGWKENMSRIAEAHPKSAMKSVKRNITFTKIYKTLYNNI